MASVSFRHVYKRFGDVSVIKDFNLEIADKEFMVFVGPSGCGKSTNLRMPVSYTHLRAHETVLDLVCRLLLEKKTELMKHH